jgi:WD40 repeat protein
MFLMVLLLSFLPTLGESAERPARKKQPHTASASTSLFVPLSYDQLISENKALSGHTSKVMALAYSPDGSRLISGGDDKTLIAWDLQNGEQAWAIKKLPDRVTNLAFCGNGEILALTTKGEHIHLVNATTGSYITGFRANKDVQSLACSSAGQLLAAAVDKSVVVWNLDTLRTPSAEVSETGTESGSYFSWLKRKGDSKKNEDQARADKAVIKTLQSSDQDVLSIAFSASGGHLAVAGKDTQVTIWDVQQWSKTKTLEGFEKEIRSLAFSPDGGRLVAVEDKQNILLWDLYGKPLPRLVSRERDDITSLAFSADGAMLVTVSKKRAVIWNTHTYRELHTLSDEKWEPLAVQCSPDNSGLAIAGEDKLVHLWNLPGIISMAASGGERGDALKALDQERDGRIKALYPKKNEFESSQEHAGRLKLAKAAEQALRSEYAARRTALADQLEQQESRLKRQYYPFSSKGELGRYDADQQRFYSTLGGESITIPVPARIAKELAGRRETLLFSGMIRYHDPQRGELVNGALVDPTSGERFPFGKQVDGVTASTVSPALQAELPVIASKRRAVPNLEIVSVTLVEPSGNNALDAGERGSIRVVLRNSGNGSAEGVSITLHPDGTAVLPATLLVAERTSAGELGPNQSRTIDVPISAAEEVPGREIRLQVAALEAGGFDAQPVLMDFSLKALIPPYLQVARIEISDAEGKRVIAKGKESNVIISVQNAGKGAARGVAVKVISGDPQVKLFGDSEVTLGLLMPGESKRATFTIAVTQRYTGPKTLPVSFQVAEERPRFTIKPQLQLALNKEAPEIRLVKMKEREVVPVATEQDEIALAPLLAVTRRAFNDRDLALVIGIERYQNVPKSDFAYNDARSIKSYLLSLGFVERNIEFLADERATLSAIRKSVESWLPNRVKPGSRIFFYYSGHGAPDPATGEAFIVPFDGDPSYLNDTGYPIKRLYEKLGAAKAAEVIVVMDSCFSGSGGRSVVAKGARPLVLMADTLVIPPGMAILASTQGSQISTSFEEKEHGVFTYYFLKAIKEGKGDLDSVYRYIKPLVEDTAKSQNVNQSPVLNTDKQEARGRFRLLQE